MVATASGNGGAESRRRVRCTKPDHWERFSGWFAKSSVNATGGTAVNSAQRSASVRRTASARSVYRKP